MTEQSPREITTHAFNDLSAQRDLSAAQGSAKKKQNLSLSLKLRQGSGVRYSQPFESASASTHALLSSRAHPHSTQSNNDVSNLRTLIDFDPFALFTEEPQPAPPTTLQQSLLAKRGLIGE